jgi:hypothetical protein
MRLSSFFKTSSKWTQNAMARNIHGKPINLNEYHPDITKDRDSRVEQLSLQGALAFFFSQEREPERREQELMKFRRAIAKYTGQNLYVAEFNNREETTFEDIKAVIKIAETSR